MNYEGKTSAVRRSEDKGADNALGAGKQTLTMALPPIQRKPSGAEPAGGEPVAPSTGGGIPMPPPLRAKMEASFGADFSAVRIHEDAQAAAMGARAFTQGSHIHFAPGEYQPETQPGQELLGHELAHVVQQAQGRVQDGPQAKGAAVNDDPALEHEADQLGARAARGERSSGAIGTVAGSARGGVAQPKWERTEGKDYQAWDAVIANKRWYRKLTPMGFQYASEPPNTDRPMKIFLTARTLRDALPVELALQRTNVVFGTQDRSAIEVTEAFHVGYREFDTAESYQNIKQVADGLKSFERAQCRIIYKFNMRLGDELVNHVGAIAGLFGDYLDVAMIHNLPDSPEQLSAAVKTMTELKRRGAIRQLGLSGVEQAQANPETLAGVDVVENDVMKPDHDRGVQEVCQKLGIEYLGHGISHMINPDVDDIARTHGVSSTALVLAWARTHGVRPLMSSGKTERRIANADASNEAVPDEAVRALADHLVRSTSKKKVASVDSLPPAPSLCEGPINTLLQMTFLENDQWTIAKAKYGEVREQMKFFRLLGPHLLQPVPAVVEVESTYHGKSVGAVVRALPGTNHCDRQKLFQAFVAGLRNTEATPLEDI